jgi:hypothetical protein
MNAQNDSFAGLFEKLTGAGEAQKGSAVPLKVVSENA